MTLLDAWLWGWQGDKIFVTPDESFLLILNSAAKTIYMLQFNVSTKSVVAWNPLPFPSGYTPIDIVFAPKVRPPFPLLQRRMGLGRPPWVESPSGSPPCMQLLHMPRGHQSFASPAPCSCPLAPASALMPGPLLPGLHLLPGRGPHRRPGLWARAAVRPAVRPDNSGAYVQDQQQMGFQVRPAPPTLPICSTL